MTAEQAAAIAGMTVKSVREKRVLSACCSAGLLDYGVSSLELRSRARAAALPHLPFLRPANSASFERLVEPNCTYAELLAVTGGLPFGQDRQFDRHNVLATEFGLRAAEFLPQIGAVLAEKMSRGDLLFPLPAGSQIGGDLVLVRGDGLRIVVEMTTRIGSAFREKVERWANLLSRHSLASSGVVVLFVDVSRPSESHGRGNLSQLRKRVSAFASAHPGPEGRSVADRMFVASWPDLFPGPNAVSEGFLELAAWCPARPARQGATASNNRWVRRSLLDPSQVVLGSTAEQQETLQAVLTTAQMLAGSPYWLRSERDMGVWNVMLERAGVDRIPLRPALTKRRLGDGSWGVPPEGAADVSVFPGIGGDLMPRRASRGLVLAPPSRLIAWPDAAVPSPGWQGVSSVVEEDVQEGVFDSFGDDLEDW